MSVTTSAAGFRDVLRRHPALAALNGALLAACFLTWGSSGAGAQGRGNGVNRARGEYTMLSGKLNQGGPPGIFIVDSANQEIVALQWDISRSTFAGIGFRDLKLDAKAVPSR